MVKKIHNFFTFLTYATDDAERKRTERTKKATSDVRLNEVVR